MKKVRDLSLQELDQIFRAATGAAREEAVAHGLPIVGVDKDGSLFKLDADRTTLLKPEPDRTKKVRQSQGRIVSWRLQLSDSAPPFCLCLAGPNGSGKSTLTAQIRTIHSLENWIDPDVVAREMGDELAAFGAARNRRVDFAQGLFDFGFETVFSHSSNADFLEALKILGYEVHLYFVCTDDPRINVNRVSNRVRLGGHDVPTDRIFDRYSRSLDNLVLSVGKFDRIVLFDNSSIDGAGRVVAEIANAPVPRVTLNPKPQLPSWVTRTVSLAYTRGQPEPAPMLQENAWYKNDPDRREELLNQFRM